MKLIGFDPAPNKSGVCWNFPNFPNTLNARRIATDTIEPPQIAIQTLRAKGRVTTRHVPMVGAERLNFWANWLIEEIARGYDHIAMEAPSYGSRGINDAIELNGVLKYICHNRGVKVVTVAPSQVKLWATGAGDANKEATVFTAAIARFGDGIKTHDEGDAAFLAEIGYYYFSGLEGRNPHECQVLAGLRGDKVEKEAIAKQRSSAAGKAKRAAAKQAKALEKTQQEIKRHHQCSTCFVGWYDINDEQSIECPACHSDNFIF